jgi:hypothetical protein
MPEEELNLSPKEMAVLQRLADAKQTDVSEVVQVIAVMALLEYPRVEDGKK